MFFGWNKVSKKSPPGIQLAGCNWSQPVCFMDPCCKRMDANPIGMQFNPETARNEMVNFWDVLFSPVAVNKFLHTISSGYVLASIFVIGVSAWFLLQKRNVLFARRSIVVAAIFGFLSSIQIIATGDGSARQVAKSSQ